MAINMTVDLDKAKAFDELTENIQDLSELCDLVPSWQHEEARVIAKRIVDRHVGWITIKESDA